jgi:hypothetical protein
VDAHRRRKRVRRSRSLRLGVFLWSTLTLTWLTGFLVARLRLRPLPSALLVLGMTAAVFVWLVLRAIYGHSGV